MVLRPLWEELWQVYRTFLIGASVHDDHGCLLGSTQYYVLTLGTASAGQRARGRDFLSVLRFDITRPLAKDPENPAIVQLCHMTSKCPQCRPTGCMKWRQGQVR